MHWWLFLLFLFPLTSLTAKLVLDKQIQSECVVLINGDTGHVLWKRNPDKLCYPASTTKIATAFYALMNKSQGLHEKVTAPKEALITVTPQEKMRANYTKCPSYLLETDGAHAGIKAGEIMTLEDLLYATLLPSANDAANVVAYHVGSGSISTFVDDMNKFMFKIGCQKTHFCNPHGLHHPEHVTTARDMARLAQCAMYHPLFRKMVKTTNYERKRTNKQPKARYTQRNKLLCPGKYFYPYATGIKSGYTSKALGTLVASAEKDGRRLIAAIMQSKDKNARFVDAHTLFNAAFREQKVTKTLLSPGKQRFSRTFEDAKDPLTTYTTKPLQVSFYPSEEPELRCELTWSINAVPIQQNQEVGSFRLFADNVEVASCPLFAENAVDQIWSAKLLSCIKEHWFIGTSILFLLVCFLGGFARRRR